MCAVPTLVISAQVGAHDVGQHVHLAAVVHAHLEHRVAVLRRPRRSRRGAARSRSSGSPRSPPWARARERMAADDLLRRRLAVGARHADPRDRRQRAACARGQAPGARPACPGPRRCPGPWRAARLRQLAAAARGLRLGDQQRRGARRGGLAEELVPVGALAGQAPRRGTRRRPCGNRARPRRSAVVPRAATTAPPVAGDERGEGFDRRRFARCHHRAGPPSGAVPTCSRVTADGSGGHEAEAGGLLRDPLGRAFRRRSARSCPCSPPAGSFCSLLQGRHLVGERVEAVALPRVEEEEPGNRQAERPPSGSSSRHSSHPRGFSRNPQLRAAACRVAGHLLVGGGHGLPRDAGEAPLSPHIDRSAIPEGTYTPCSSRGRTVFTILSSRE